MVSKSFSPDSVQILAEIGLRQFPTDWDIVRIETLISAERGIAVGVMYPGDYDPKGVPLIRSGDLTGDIINRNPDFRISAEKHREYKRTELCGGELLISLVGDVGRCALVPTEMAGWNAARAVAVLRFRDPDDASFVRACLMSAPFQHLMKAWSTTTVQATLNLKEIRQIPLPWPPKSYRRHTVATLKALDDKIELNRRLNETLEAMARAIFKDWFVDFGPTRAKMAMRGEDPQREGTARAPYLAPDLWALFPDRLDDDGKPEEWKKGKLGEIAATKGETVNPDNIPADTPYIGLEHMPRKSIALDAWESAGKVSSNKTSFAKGDVLFGKLRPYFHKVGVAPISGISSTDIVVLGARNFAFSAYVLCCVSQDEFVAFADRGSDGTKMPRTSWSKMSAFNVVLPTDSVAIAFQSICQPLIDRLIANVLESQTLAQTRDLLLPKLMSGEIRIKDTERHLASTL